jgi:two-component system cell cycle sensor histidine kinase PleC
MTPKRSTTTDKNIVDRRKAHRNTDVARAIRKTRDRLSQRTGNPVYDREMLALHAQTVVSAASILPLLILAVTVVWISSFGPYFPQRSIHFSDILPGG